MNKAAVIGDPVQHSLSPVLFSLLSKHTGNSLDYQAVRVTSLELQALLARAKTEYVGLNVTIPHKERILQYIDAVDDDVRIIRALNVVHFMGSRAIGHNTDVYGITATLNEHNVKLEGKNVLVYGAGGAARAVCYALAKLKARKVSLCNRSVQKALEVVQTFNGSCPHTKFDALTDSKVFLHEADPVSVVINATPIGMEGLEKSTDAASSWSLVLKQIPLDKDPTAFDLIYRPLYTPFLEESAKAGMSLIGGLDMLVYQALATWRIWFGAWGTSGGPGAVANDFTLKAGLVRALKKILFKGELPLFLSGFMGVGKSSVGRELAQKLGFEFLDTDEMIQKQTGLSISEIFARRGEAVFRELESKVIESICHQKRVVVALGGGALTNSKSLERLRLAGSLIFLSAPLSELAQRLWAIKETRPLLKDAKTPDELKALLQSLYDSREPHYQKAEWHIPVGSLTPGQIADEIMRHVCQGVS